MNAHILSNANAHIEYLRNTGTVGWLVGLTYARCTPSFIFLQLEPTYIPIMSGIYVANLFAIVVFYGEGPKLSCPPAKNSPAHRLYLRLSKDFGFPCT